ncbi:hypothetical protein Tco_0483851 [Tanacetum coccineum]
MGCMIRAKLEVNTARLKKLVLLAGVRTASRVSTASRKNYLLRSGLECKTQKEKYEILSLFFFVIRVLLEDEVMDDVVIWFVVDSEIVLSVQIQTTNKLLLINPGTQHWQAIQRVLKYLKKTIDYRLTYTGYPLVLEGYTDGSWISNTEDNSSTSGWVFLLGGGAISWASKKQTCITGSTIESEFVALTAAAPISIPCDSAATLAKAYSQMYNGKFRHLGVRHSMIRELITNGVISIEFVRSQQKMDWLET